MKEYYKKQVSQLNTLITMLIGQLNPGDRQKVMTICTIDVHARDVVAKIIAQKVSLFFSISYVLGTVSTAIEKRFLCIRHSMRKHSMFYLQNLAS